ncbi:hypothetical protein OAN61_00355 [bacterium]|nr:hypothetical protein [bacterium]
MASAMEARGKERERDVETRSVINTLLPLLSGAALRRVCSAAILELQAAEDTSVNAAASAHRAWVQMQQHQDAGLSEGKREREENETHKTHTQTHTQKVASARRRSGKARRTPQQKTTGMHIRMHTEMQTSTAEGSNKNETTERKKGERDSLSSVPPTPGANAARWSFGSAGWSVSQLQSQWRRESGWEGGTPTAIREERKEDIDAKEEEGGEESEC